MILVNIDKLPNKAHWMSPFPSLKCVIDSTDYREIGHILH